MAKHSKKSGPGTIAYTADRHELYEKAVQDVSAEIDMVDETFESIRGFKAKTLREDFCGTGNTSCEWVRRRHDNLAIGLDLDSEVLEWGRKNKLSKLNEEQRARLTLLQQDVMQADCASADVLLAMNFSYQIFKTRDSLRQYFEQARAGLNENGLLFIDAYGGHDSWKEVKEKTKYKGFHYYWHQKKFNPITGDILCHIHFKFPDGSWMKKAFTYDWRSWTLPELRELIIEAGFAHVDVYWEGTDEESGEGDGTYFPTLKGDDDPSWIVYLVAQK
ncbi:MAG: class I SAM-dependent methyltransferase [Pseudomonadota bacterium]